MTTQDVTGSPDIQKYVSYVCLPSLVEGQIMVDAVMYKHGLSKYNSQFAKKFVLDLLNTQTIGTRDKLIEVVRI